MRQWQVVGFLAMAFAILLAGCGGSSSSTAGNQTATPAFSPGGGTYKTSQPVTISSATTGAVLYCTTDGTTPTTSSPQCAEPTTVYQNEYLQAIAVAPGKTASAVASAGYTITLNPVDTPTFTPAGGTYTGAQQVTIADTTSGANIYYTLDGTKPNINSTLFTGAITISQSSTLNAIAAATGYDNSDVASAAYTIQAPVPAPTITGLSPSSATAGGAAFNLTVNGTNFTSAASVLWNGASLNTTFVNAGQLTAAVPASSIASAGSVNVTVVTASGVSPVSAFTVNAGTPTVTSLTVTSGSTSGGTSVGIAGANFIPGATTVAFGGTAATSVTVNSATSITAVSPPSASAGTVDVTVTTAGGTSATSAADHFTYFVPVPTVSGLTVTSGSALGGTSVGITGTNFIAGATTVAFGGTAATSVTVNSATSITAVSPPGSSAGTVDVTVTTAGGTSATSSADLFTYVVTAPSVSNLNPSSGAVGSTVTIKGTNFGSPQGNSTVSFNGVKATTINSWSNTQISADVPATATTGPVVVTVDGSASNNDQIFSVGSTLSGTVASGTSPSTVAVVSDVQLYAAGTAGYGQAPAKVGNSVQTDTNGNFSIVYDCSALTAPGDQLYLVATSTTALSVVLMAPLGSCSGVSSLGASVTVNEVTTIASAYALSGFASMDTTSGIDIGAPVLTAKSANCTAGQWVSTYPSSCNYLGLANAFNTALNIVNVATGAVWAAPQSAAWHGAAIGMTPAYANSTGGPVQYLNDSTIPAARVNALADMLATCVQSAGSCASGLFAAAATATPSFTPKDTLQAALNIALNPGNNVATLLGLVPTSNPPYATWTLDLSNDGSAPTDLTLALTFTGAGLGLPPGISGTNTVTGNTDTSVTDSALAIDASGNIWVAGFDGSSYGTSSITQGVDVPVLAGFNGLGAPLTPATTYFASTGAITLGGIDLIQTNTGVGLSTIAIDQTGNLWIGGETGSAGYLYEISNAASSSPTMAPSISLADNTPYYLAVDTTGDLWVGSSEYVWEFTNSGAPVTLSNAQYGPRINTYLLFDSSLNLWVQTRDDVGGNGGRGVDEINTSDGSVAFHALPSKGAVSNSLVADGSGNVYGCADSSKKLDQFTNDSWINSAGAPTIATGRACGSQLVMDGQGRLFAVSNSSGGIVDEFTTAGVSISPASTGFTGTSIAEPVTLNPLGVHTYGTAAIDGSGNLWVLNQGAGSSPTGVSGNVLVEYVGIGAPVATPTSVALTNGLLGAQP